MLISTACPRCDNVYQVQDSLLGKPMRCLNPLCRHIFFIEERRAPSASPPPTPTPSADRPGQQSGTVGDLVPLLSTNEEPTPAPRLDFLEVLPSEPVTPDPEPIPLMPGEGQQYTPSWQEPPPVRRDPTPKTDPKKTASRDKPRTTDRVEPAEPTPTDGPRVFERGQWEAPPVRRGTTETPAPTPTPEPAPAPRKTAVTRTPTPEDPTPKSEPEIHHDSDHPVKPRGRLARLFILGFVLLTLAGLASGGWLLFLELAKNEEKWAAEAEELYTNGTYRAAAAKYKALAEGFPNSERLPRYEFRQELAELREKLKDVPEDLTEAFEATTAFLQKHQKTPILTEHAGHVGSSLVKLLTEYGEKAVSAVNEEALATFKQAEAVITKTKAIRLPKDATPPDWGKVQELRNQLVAAVARKKEKARWVATLKGIAAKPSYAALQELDTTLKEAVERFPELASDPEVTPLRERILSGHAASVVALEPDTTSGPATAPKEDTDISILVDPVLGSNPDPVQGDGIVLALSRGVLYALWSSTGEGRWARRVGIDTTALPLRLPRRAGLSERILVLDADTRTLTAIAPNNEPIWRYVLDTPVLGRPVVVDQRAYLATYSGDVHEVELIGGKLLRRYRLGQRLTRGGTLEPGSSRVWFPADDGCVYALDVRKRECVAIVYSGHPAGTLRGEPILVPSPGGDRPGYLILEQATGLDRVLMRVFELTAGGKGAIDVREATVKPPASMRGWTWFPPYLDPEKVLFLSDAGELGIFGIRQPGNADQPLFPQLSLSGSQLERLLYPEAKILPQVRGRAEVARVQGDDLWVLASNRLLRLRSAWEPSKGPQLVPAWKAAVEVGSPLHESQSVQVGERTSLVVTTREPGLSSTLVTSVDEDNGTPRWRRRLGLMCQTTPIPVKIPGGEPVWLAVDEAGALFSLDPTRFVPRPGAQWLSDSKQILLADSVGEVPEHPPIVLPAEDGKSVCIIAAAREREIVVRRVSAPETGRKLKVTEGRVKLSAPLAGQPAIGGNRLLMPLADGVVVRIPYPLTDDTADPEGGMPWRSDRAGSEARSVIVALSASRFLICDGARGVNSWEWAPGALPKLLPNGAEEPTLEMKERVTGMVRLPETLGSPSRIAVADSSGMVTVVEVKKGGGLEIRRSWELGGPVSHGPFVLSTAGGERIGCVVERTKLAWIDPSVKDPLWVYENGPDNELIDEPVLAGEELLIVDRGGRTRMLTAETGKPTGKGWQPTGNLSPMTPPVPFQKERFLVPMSDGTLMLVTRSKVRGE